MACFLAFWERPLARCWERTFCSRCAIILAAKRRMFLPTPRMRTASRLEYFLLTLHYSAYGSFFSWQLVPASKMGGYIWNHWGQVTSYQMTTLHMSGHLVE